jgi:hypothetical protein
VDTRDSFDINFVTSDGCNPESLVCLYSWVYFTKIL